MTVENPQLFIITAPSGTGKTTLVKRLMSASEDLAFSVSHTTRPAREGEVNGRDYHFISEAEFKQLRDQDVFLEWAVVHGNYYGTSRIGVQEQLDSGFDIVLDIDVAGADQVRQAWPDAISIFIMPPSLESLRSRLNIRNLDSQGVIERRIKNSQNEVKRFRAFDFVVVNDHLDRCYNDLTAIFRSQRLRTANLRKKIENLIENSF